MTKYAAVTATIVEFLNASTVATTEIDREIQIKSDRKKGLQLLGDLIVFKLINDVSPGFVDKLEIKVNEKVNELEDAACLCRKMRAHVRRELEDVTAMRVAISGTWVYSGVFLL